MPFLLLAVLLLLLYRPLRRIRHALAIGQTALALRCYRRVSWALGGLIWGAMLVQEGILLFGGQLTWQTGLPLHLCSLMGVLSLPMLLTRHPVLCHTALYAGVPGALLALAFPAALPTPWPRMTMFSFCTLHAGLAAAPALPLAMGWQPRPAGAVSAWCALFLAACIAMAVNSITGANYLFLAGPIAGTPLILLGQWGLTVYRALLAALVTIILTLEALVVHLWHKKAAPFHA